MTDMIMQTRYAFRVLGPCCMFPFSWNRLYIGSTHCIYRLYTLQQTKCTNQPWSEEWIKTFWLLRSCFQLLNFIYTKDRTGQFRTSCSTEYYVVVSDSPQTMSNRSATVAFWKPIHADVNPCDFVPFSALHIWSAHPMWGGETWKSRHVKDIQIRPLDAGLKDLRVRTNDRDHQQVDAVSRL